MMRGLIRSGSRLALGLVVVVALVVGIAFVAHFKDRETTTLLVSPIAGALPQIAQVNDKIVAAFDELRARHENVVVRRLEASITEAQGSSEARTLGRRHGGALLVWGFQSAGASGELLTIVVENLASPKALRLTVGEYVVEGILAEPSRLTVTKRLGGDLNALVVLAKAGTRYQLGDWSEAISLFTAVLEEGTSPQSRSALLLSRGNAALLSTMPQRALADYSESLQSDSASAEIRRNLGLAHAALKDQSAALLEYAASRTIDSEDEALYLNRGISYALQGEHERAITEYASVLRQNPKAARAHLNQGVSRAAQGDHRRAIEDFTRAIDAGSGVAAYIDRGHSRAAVGDHKQAVSDFSRALQADSRDVLALVGRGRSRSALKDQAGAIADLTAALQVDPQLPVAYYERAIAYTILNRSQEALDDFSAAIRLNPGYADAYKGRGVSRMLRREYPQALDDLSRAIQMAPRDAEAFFHRGITHRLRGEPQKAVPDMEKVLELSRDPALRKQAEEQLRQIRAEP
jgi:tetratricopeptide (TPR) repeat protein